MIEFHLTPVPHVIHKKDLPVEIDGRARAFYVELDKKATKVTKLHELTHVIQWYVISIFTIMPFILTYLITKDVTALIASPLAFSFHSFLYFMSKAYRTEAEAMAFGYSISGLKPSSRDNYVYQVSQKFSKHYDTSKYSSIDISNKIYNYFHLLVDKFKL
jgi:hypothetical protein